LTGWKASETHSKKPSAGQSEKIIAKRRNLSNFSSATGTTNQQKDISRSQVYMVEDYKVEEQKLENRVRRNPPL
jgi:hypothetical protein